MKIATIAAFVVKISGSTAPIFRSLDVTFVDSKFSFEIRSWTNILISKILTRNNVNNNY